MKRVTPGPFRYPASAFNRIIEAAEAHQLSKHEQRREPTRDVKSQTVILIRNSSGAPVSRFGALGIGQVLARPSHNEVEFANRIMVNGTEPDAEHLGRFAILLEPLVAGAIGKAVVSGVVQCRVEFPEEDEDFELRFADLNLDEEADAPLIARGHGSAQILALSDTAPSQTEGGSASTTSFSKIIDGGDAFTTEWDAEVDAGTESRVRWCIVRMGNSTIGERFTVMAEIDGGSNGTDSATASWTWTVKTLAGATIAEEVPAVRYRPNTIYVEPTTPVYGEAFYDEEGDLVLYELDIWEDEEDC